ncbi:hypothetical protein FQN57_004995 [Myotisia sp. PD_48]|nr:hypothetical protein FQN57_004995 [Myotisia sp. PD_48]
MAFPPVHIVHAKQEHTHTVILLHGRASDGPEFAEEINSSSQNLVSHFPGFRWVFPTSKSRWSSVFQEEFPAWFDIASLTNTCEKPELQVDGLRESMLYNLDIIRQEIDLLGGNSKKLIFGGMSQGMATALWTLLCSPGRIQGEIGAFLGFCGWMPFADKIESFLEDKVEHSAPDTDEIAGSNSKVPKLPEFALDIIKCGGREEQAPESNVKTMLSTPVLLLHGSDDAYVDVELGRQAHRLLVKMGMKAHWEEYSGADNEGHWVKEPEGFDRIISFLATLYVLIALNTFLARPANLFSSPIRAVSYVMEPRYGDLYNETVAVVEGANLSPTEHLFFQFLLYEAIDQEAACRFILEQVSKGSQTNSSTEDVLRGIKADLANLAKRCCLWKDPISADVEASLRQRQGNRCYVSGFDINLKPTYILSPSIFDGEDLKPGGRLRPLFEAVVSVGVTEKISALFEACKDDSMNHLRNLWLMSFGVQAAFQYGHIRMQKSRFGGIWSARRRFDMKATIVGLENDRFKMQPSTPDERALPLPDDYLLDAHRVISWPLDLLPLEHSISRGWPPVQRHRKLGSIGRYLLRLFYSFIPSFFCLILYRFMLRLVDRFNPQTDPYFKYLPFGLCLKIGNRVSKNEANALLLVEKYTSIPAPQLINFTFDKKEGKGYLLMTSVPGVPAENVFLRMSYEERHQMARDLGKYIAQYRRIPNQNKYLFCDTIGGPLIDHRTESAGPCDPCNSKSDFLDHIIHKDIRNEPSISALYNKEHATCFTHSDLHLSNLTVEGGRLCGLIDFEHAGFRPEFYEYTKAVWAYSGRQDMVYLFSLAFDEDYKEELDSEKEIWRLYPTY